MNAALVNRPAISQRIKAAPRLSRNGAWRRKEKGTDLCSFVIPEAFARLYLESRDDRL
jgi:hypothetical protein